MLYGYAIFQIKLLFARKAIHHNPTNCPYFLSDLQSKTPNKKSTFYKNQQAYQAQKNDLGGLKNRFQLQKEHFIG